MITAVVAEQFVDSPLGATVVGVALTALITVTVAVIRMMVTVTVMGRDLADLKQDLKEFKESNDLMRYSDMREVARIKPRGTGPGRRHG